MSAPELPLQDGTEKLCQAVYGRKALPRDYLGGSDARMLHDAAEEITRLRPYNGQPHTDTGERGRTEIRGITFRDLRDCYIRAICLSNGIDFPAQYAEAMKGEHAALCENDIYAVIKGTDPMAVYQNLSCEIERLMGIYPNVPPLIDAAIDKQESPAG